MAFAGVHDSFWTHPGCVDRMNEVLRDKFVELHSQPLLDMLLEDFQALYPDLEFPPVPSLVRSYHSRAAVLEILGSSPSFHSVSYV